jgi:hypothetical protein
MVMGLELVIPSLATSVATSTRRISGAAWRTTDPKFDGKAAFQATAGSRVGTGGLTAFAMLHLRETSAQRGRNQASSVQVPLLPPAAIMRH